jgi:cyclin H
MEWHPKVIMPTCLYLAAKTTNHNIPIKDFVKKFEKFKADDVLDLEFLVAQSLSFEFWVRGAERALRGWALELQSSPVPGAGERAQRALPKALEALAASRMTDAEFLFSPAQIALACWRVADRELTDAFLNAKYDAAGEGKVPFGIGRDELLRVSGEVEAMVRTGEAQHDLKKVKEVDKRLKGCANPEKVPGTAL